MIPVELKLVNFMSYGSEGVSLGFDSFNIACLTGDNGNGKSALLDAITWSIWGMARGTDERGSGVDDLVRSGAENMEVEFTFTLEGNVYRVCRRRDKRRGKSSLEFQIVDGDIYRSITGDNLAATQQKIIQILRMDYQTFISSSFLLQGKADTFTAKKASDRKKILGEILGLSIYEDLEVMAREEYNNANATDNQLRVRLQEIQQELEQLDQHQKLKQQLDSEQQDLKSQLSNQQKQLDDLRTKLSELKLIQQRVQELNSQLANEQQQISALEERVKKLRQLIKQSEELLIKEEEIHNNYHRLRQLLEQDKDLNVKSRLVMQMKDQRRDVELEIITQRSMLEKQYIRIKGEFDHYNNIINQSPSLLDNAEKLLQQINILKELENRQGQLKDMINEYTQEERTKESLVVKLQEQVGQLREKYSLLRRPMAQCPLCRSELPEGDRERVLAEMIQEAENNKEEILTLQGEIQKLINKKKYAKNELAEVETKLVTLPGLEQQQSICQHKLKEVDQAKNKLNELNATIDNLQQTLESKDYAPDLFMLIKDIDTKICELNYSPEFHGDLQGQIAELKTFEKMYNNLQIAQSTLENHRDNLQHFESSLNSLQSAALNTKELMLEHSLKLKDITIIINNIKTAEDNISTLQNQMADIQRSLGSVQEKIDRCHKLAEEKDVLTKEIEAAAKEKAYYHQLVKAFGKKGIQALIIENAIPELEREANGILHQISDGRLTVALITQKTAKTRKNVVETLEIVISDEFSTRRYEMYSGGEAFRVNFALRIALSRLLAKRAGARLQMLVIDEGFGTQDNQGRERLVQAINAIADDFEKIIVITHIEEIKHAFPIHLIVTKGDSGSEIQLL